MDTSTCSDILTATRCRSLGVGLLSDEYSAANRARRAPFASTRTPRTGPCTSTKPAGEGNVPGRVPTVSLVHICDAAGRLCNGAAMPVDCNTPWRNALDRRR